MALELVRNCFRISQESYCCLLLWQKSKRVEEYQKTLKLSSRNFVSGSDGIGILQEFQSEFQSDIFYLPSISLSLNSLSRFLLRDKHQREELWLEKILPEKLDGYGIVSEFLKNSTAVWQNSECVEVYTKELWNYSVRILSVDQMASEFFKRIPVWIPIGYFLLTRNFSFVEFTIKISTEVNINLRVSGWKKSPIHRKYKSGIAHRGTCQHSIYFRTVSS